MDLSLFLMTLSMKITGISLDARGERRQYSGAHQEQYLKGKMKALLSV